MSSGCSRSGGIDELHARGGAVEHDVIAADRGVAEHEGVVLARADRERRAILGRAHGAGVGASLDRDAELVDHANRARLQARTRDYGRSAVQSTSTRSSGVVPLTVPSIMIGSPLATSGGLVGEKHLIATLGSSLASLAPTL